MNEIKEAVSEKNKDTEYPNPVYAWYCVGVIVFAYFFGFMDRILVGLLTPAIQKDLGFSDTQMGVIQGLAFAIFYTLFVIPIGWATDRYNRKWLLTAGTTIWSLFTAGFGLVKSFWGLFSMRVGVGIGESALNPCSASIISDSFEPRRRAKAYGVYVLGTAFGTGLTYLFGGWLIKFTGAYSDKVSTFNMPIIGEIASWQAVFIIIGIAGLIPAILLALTVREPSRKEISTKQNKNATWSEIFNFIGENKKTIICHNLGLAFILMSIYGWVNWLPALFIRVHGWDVPQFSFWYGIFGGLGGIFSAVTAGYVTNWFKDKGYNDGTMRAVLWGSIGLTVGTIIAPIMPTPELTIIFFVLAGCFTNWPTSQALFALNEITPNQIRGTIISIYIVVIGIGGAGLGPLAIGWVTDNVFNDPSQINYSMSLVTLVMGTLGCFLIQIGLKPFRESLSRSNWK